MREIIDEMFFWNAEGLFIDDFCEECFETRQFVESILALNHISYLNNRENYNQKLSDFQHYKCYGFFDNILRFFVKEKIKRNNDANRRINENFQKGIDFSKAMNDPYQKKLD